MRCITRNYICWIHGEVVGTTAHSSSLLLLSSKCKLDVIRTLSVYLHKFCANLQEQQKEKRLSDVALVFSALTLCVSQDFIFLPPRSMLPSFSKSFSSYFFLSEHYVFKFFWSFLCFLSSGIPEVQRAMMHMNSWHCGFKSDSWPLSQVSQDSGLSHIKPRWLSSPEKKGSIGFAFKCLGQSMSTFSW